MVTSHNDFVNDETYGILGHYIEDLVIESFVVKKNGTLVEVHIGS